MHDRTIYSTDQFQSLIDKEFNKMRDMTPWEDEFSMNVDAYYSVQDSMFPFRGDQVPEDINTVYAAIGSLEALREIGQKYQVVGLYIHELDPEDISEIIRLINSMHHLEDLYLRLQHDDLSTYEGITLSGLKRYRCYEILCKTPNFVLSRSYDTLTHFRWDPSDLSELGNLKYRILNPNNNGDIYRLQEVKYVKVPSSIFRIDEYGDKIEYLDISTYSSCRGSRRKAVNSRLFSESWSKYLQRLKTVRAGWISKIGLIRLLSYPNIISINANLLSTVSIPVNRDVSPIRSLKLIFEYVMPSATTPYLTIPNSLYNSLEYLSLSIDSMVDREVYEEYVLSRIRMSDFKLLQDIHQDN